MTANLNRLQLLKAADVPATYFATYCGINRVTVGAWLHRTDTKPRGPYWDKASAALDKIENALKEARLPLARRGRTYAQFVAALDA